MCLHALHRCRYTSAHKRFFFQTAFCRQHFVIHCTVVTHCTYHKVIHTYLLTPWCRVLPEQLTLAACQEIPRISRNPKVHYRTHKLTSTVPILGQPNPIHMPTSHLLEIHPNIIHPSKHRSPHLLEIHPNIL